MIANHKGEIPVVILLLPFLAGITCGLSYTLPPFVFWISGAIGITFIILNFAYSRLPVFKVRWLGGLLMYIILFLLGWIFTYQHNELNNNKHFAGKPAQYLAVVINSEPVIKNDLTRFTASVKQRVNNGVATPASGSLLITIKDELAQNLFYGEELLIPAKYQAADPPFNPGEFNYKRYLANKNIYYQAFIYPKQYTVVAAAKGNPVIAYALRLRQNLVKKLKLNMPDSTAAAVASTLILGYKADLGNDVLQSYSKTGTIHILSVSGGHVAIIYLLLSWALSFLSNNKRGKTIKAIVIIALIWAYSLLSGFSPAVCRAALMISLVIGGKAYSRYINSLNLLATSAFLLLLYDPFLITDVGFQLSYLAVAGLIVFQPIVYKWFTFKNTILNKLWLACSVSIAAQVITFPLSAYYFHQFPVYFLLSNLFIIIPVSLIMYSGLLLLALPQIPAVSKALGYFLDKCIMVMNKGLSVIEHAPFASINKIWLTQVEYLLMSVIIFLLFYFMFDRKAWLIKIAAFCLLLFSISISYKHIKADSTRSITFLNLRKHRGIVFKNGNTGVVVTDLADTDRNFTYAIQPCLDSNRISTYRVVNFNAPVQLPYMIKQNNFIRFLNKTVLILNDEAPIKSIPQGFDINYLFISDNTSGYPNALNKGTGEVILDAANSDQYIKQLEPLLRKQHLNYRILRRNKSVTVLSN
ncbi:DUF4131 domain-containing protein [Inquilinus sp. KBS0705]|nr:DUF4131 domain-containing protein [Inquilinus sp. KBS0705]